MLQAVDVRDMRHLRNLVVFSQQGSRPTPNEISGSDLDGDLYFCSWDDRLIPVQNHPPMNYDAQQIKELDRVIFSWPLPRHEETWSSLHNIIKTN